jgi:hypothetical protein
MSENERLHQGPGPWGQQHWALLHLAYVALRTARLRVTRLTVECEDGWSAGMRMTTRGKDSIEMLERFAERSQHD